MVRQQMAVSTSFAAAPSADQRTLDVLRANRLTRRIEQVPRVGAHQRTTTSMLFLLVILLLVGGAVLWRNRQGPPSD
jgi:hypothetical protein